MSEQLHGEYSRDESVAEGENNSISQVVLFSDQAYVTRKVSAPVEPGLWWRIGRRIGVGGVTPASQSKVMADLITARLIERDQSMSS